MSEFDEAVKLLKEKYNCVIFQKKELQGTEKNGDFVLVYDGQGVMPSLIQNDGSSTTLCSLYAVEFV